MSGLAFTRERGPTEDGVSLFVARVDQQQLPTFVLLCSTDSDQLSLREVWEQSCAAWLFLSKPPADSSKLIEWWSPQIENTGKRQLLIAWVRDPESPGRPEPGARLPFGERLAKRNDMFLPLASHRLNVPEGSEITLDERRLLLRIKPDDEQSRLSAAGSSAQEGWPLEGTLDIVLSSAGVGSLRCRLRAQRSPSLGSLVACQLVVESDAARTLTYPIFDWPRIGCLLDLTFDPLNPGNSRFDFPLSCKPIPSHFVTTVGERLQLLPGAQSRLELTLDRQEEKCVFAPSGEFEIDRVHGWRDPAQLVCGLSGTEGIELRSGDRLRFRPGRPGFVSQGRLTHAATTAWVSVVNAERPRFFVQSAHQPFHGPVADSGTSLAYFAMPSGWIAQADEEGVRDGFYPLLPYAGVSSAIAGRVRVIERDVVAPARRELLERLLRDTALVPAPVEAGDTSGDALADVPAEVQGTAEPVTVVTPRGLIAEVDPLTGAIKTLELARVGIQRLRLQDVPRALTTALMREQHFVVLSRPPAFAEGGAGLTLDGWQFDLSPENWRARRTLMIVKFVEGKSVEKLASDLAAWTKPKAFSDHPNLVAQRLSELIREAETSHDAELQRLYHDVLAADDWNGILFLSCHASASGLPDELAALRAGLDEKRFFAHHLGIERTSLRGQDLPSEAEGRSSVFALIRYQGVQPAPPVWSDFGFRVETLSAAFHHSHLTHFEVDMSLAVRRVLGAPCRGDPVMRLHGTLNRPHGYTFTLSDAVVLDTDDAVLDGVTIWSARFETISRGEQQSDPVVGRFVWNGSLRFTPALSAPYDNDAEPIDLIGYDGLGFEELRLVMTAEGTRRDFKLDMSALRFESTAARDRSMPRALLMTPTGMLDSSGGDRLSGLGYLPVQLPVDLSPPGKEWYALVFEANLGSQGALAGSTLFRGDFAVLWSPHPSRAQVAAGLRLPGFSAGAFGFTIEDVLSLEARGVKLLQRDGTFALRLTGLALNLLGLSLPPGGAFDLLLFGENQSDVLAWYGAYASD